MYVMFGSVKISFILDYRLQFLYGAQLARMVNPFIFPRRHTSFENFLGKVNTFLFDARTHALFFEHALQHDFI
jgi:hypothetical protein